MEKFRIPLGILPEVDTKDHEYLLNIAQNFYAIFQATKVEMIYEVRKEDAEAAIIVTWWNDELRKQRTFFLAEFNGESIFL